MRELLFAGLVAAENEKKITDRDVLVRGGFRADAVPVELARVGGTGRDPVRKRTGGIAEPVRGDGKSLRRGRVVIGSGLGFLQTVLGPDLDVGGRRGRNVAAFQGPDRVRQDGTRGKQGKEE